MFYDNQPKKQQEQYKNMLKIIGSLSKLFSEAEEPYLPYRAQENVFSKYFDVENNARNDDSADACDLKNGIGIGLKTWVGQDDQKIAEFGKLRPEYENLTGIELVRKIAFYRNERIRITKNSHGLNTMVYHVVKRIPEAMCIYETAFDFIDSENLQLIENKGKKNNVYFTDNKHVYHFSLAKNTLYMKFERMVLLDKISVYIEKDPYALLEKCFSEVAEPKTNKIFIDKTKSQQQLCLRLYTVRKDGVKYVEEHSGLNQWNGGRTSYKEDENGKKYLDKITPRNPNELYIPYPVKDRNRNKSFFPPQNEPFGLTLPNGKTISAKVCQQGGKAIMSNPNKELGKWLLRDVFELQEGTLVTYKMLQIFGIDSVMFTKTNEKEYKIEFCQLGTYEEFYNEEEIKEK